jgi:Predicted membrane protein (DUF2207)
MGAGLGGHVVVAADLVERWRDLGPTLWLLAAAAAVAWFAIFGVLAMLSAPRRVEPGPETLDLPGTEPPAVVNLVTGDWDLGHEAVPATLLDLAACGRVAIDQVGDSTLVRVRADRPGDDRLTGYERMVLDHVRSLARHTADGAVPAEALTTGPGSDAKRWWRRFRTEVHEDARARGLSRSRWSGLQHVILIAAAAAVAVLVGLAGSTLGDDPERTDDDPLGTLVGFSAVSFGGLVALVEVVSGERDTPQGRASAARWLGLRELLSTNLLFAEQPPAGVAIWNRHLAHGAALGLAHGAVRALPLGAESDRVAWSPVTGRWRVVRISYPLLNPPGYGRHPALVIFFGVVHLGVAAVLTGTSTLALGTMTDASTDAPVALQAMAVLVVAVTGAVAARGGWMVYAGLADLFGGRRTAVGRVLRHRVRGNGDSTRWYVAVDDGMSDRILAWRFFSAVTAPQGATIRAQVSRRVGHVRDLEVLPGQTAAPAVPAPPATATDTAPPATAPTAPATPPATAPTAPTAPAGPLGTAREASDPEISAGGTA